MSIFREIPPTAGFPLYLKDFVSLFKQGIYRSSLEEDFKNYLNIYYTRLTCSGTAAFYLILESLKELSFKKTVIIPSFICPLVPLAIKRAGLNVEVCDINKDSFNFDLSGLEELCSQNKDILAIVVTHLAGIPLEFETVERIAKRYGIFLIEDAAQALGAEYQNKKVGSLGDFAFFSLCRGKGLTIYEGGIIACRNVDYAKIVDKKLKQLVKSDFLSEGLKILELFGYWAFYRPQLSWFIFRLPQIFWELQKKKLRALGEDFTINFPLHKVSKIRTLIGHAIFYRLEEQINQQRQKATYYIEGLRDIKGIKFITESKNSRANYPYLTLIFDEPQRQKEALRVFNGKGLGISRIYALAIADYDYLKGIVPNRNCYNARYLVQRLITLSTSAFLKKEELDSIINIIKSL